MSDEPVSDPLARENKIAIVLSPELNPGQMANRSAVLATGLAAHHPEIIGPDIHTKDGLNLPGFTKVPIVVLGTREPSDVLGLWQRARQNGCTTLVYLSRAQGERSYEGYRRSISASGADSLDVDAFLIFGPKKSVNKVTGSLKMVR